jgi:endonuclease-3 related protein
LQTTPEWELEGLLRPAGYFRVKCGRLKSFVAVLAGEFGGDLRQLFAGTTAEVRSRLLSINGVGPETADSMLLYAGGHLSFVVDAYTKRVFARHGWCQADADYHELQRLCSSCLIQKPRSQQLEYWQDYHAQLVMVGKRFCSNRKPLCLECPLKPLLPEAGPQELSVKRRRSPALSAAKDYGPA